MKKRITIVVAAVAVFSVWLVLDQPDWLQRIGQRREVYARVQAAGGWNALRGDCQRLLQTNQVGSFLWYKGQINELALPPAIAALHPKSVYAYSPKLVSISVYGTGESPGRGIPNYYLEVDFGPPMDQKERIYPTCIYRKISDGIYEIY